MVAFDDHFRIFVFSCRIVGTRKWSVSLALKHVIVFSISFRLLQLRHWNYKIKVGYKIVSFDLTCPMCDTDSTSTASIDVKRTCCEKSANDSRKLAFVNGRELKFSVMTYLLLWSLCSSLGAKHLTTLGILNNVHYLFHPRFFFEYRYFCDSFRWYIIMATQRAHLLLDSKSICRASYAPTTPNNTRLVEEVSWPLHITPLESTELQQTPSTPLKVS